MMRGDLVLIIEGLGCHLVRHGGAHDWYRTPATGISQPVPVHEGGKGLGNPFKGKTAEEIDAMFRAKGFSPRGPAPVKGLGGYVDPKTGRSHHINPKNSFDEPPHVDVNRLRICKGPLDKKKYDY